MPWIARYDGEKMAPRQVPRGEDAECLTCGGTVRVRGPFEDGRARHFFHIDNLGGGGGGRNGSSCESVAESDVHMKWKSLAADRLEEVFDGNIASCKMEQGLDAPKSGQDRRVADVLCEFETSDDVLGDGIAVEVQHKNESKDIDATTRDYIAQDYAVVWLSGSDFAGDRCTLVEVDFRHRAWEAVWPNRLPLRVGRSNVLLDDIRRKWRRAKDRDLTTSTVPATLPNEVFDERARELWESQPWNELFERSDVNRYRLQVALAGGTPTVHSAVSFPEQVVDSITYEHSDWDSLFTPKEATDQPPVELDIDIAPFLPKAFWWKAYAGGGTDDVDIQPPPNAFDDVQCHKCGHYIYWKEAGERCENCNSPFDWEWNIRTGRIAAESVPDGMLPKTS